MKTRILLLGAAASLAMASAANASHFHGWYFGLEAGASWISDEDVDNDTIFFGGFSPTTSTFDTGWAGMGTLGYAWDNMRAELELGYRSNDLEDFVVGATTYTGGGEFNEFSQMFNLLVDIPLGSRWALTLGAGIGGDSINYKNDSGFHTVPIHDSDYVFAWQLIGGLNYATGPRSELFVDYRYFNAQDPEFTEIDALARIHNDTYDSVTKHTVTIGWRYDLHEDMEPAPPPPPPAPPPPPPPMANSFVVFFGAGKCNISPEADAVLGEAASAAKSSGSASIRVVGHTDTVGSKGANKKLSECRADAAKSNLVGKGVPAGAISAEGHGETELMVQTPDNTPEPQNNRVTVDLK